MTKQEIYDRIPYETKRTWNPFDYYAFWMPDLEATARWAEEGTNIPWGMSKKDMRQILHNRTSKRGLFRVCSGKPSNYE